MFTLQSIGAGFTSGCSPCRALARVHLRVFTLQSIGAGSPPGVPPGHWRGCHLRVFTLQSIGAGSPPGVHPQSIGAGLTSGCSPCRALARVHLRVLTLQSIGAGSPPGVPPGHWRGCHLRVFTHRALARVSPPGVDLAEHWRGFTSGRSPRALAWVSPPGAHLQSIGADCLRAVPMAAWWQLTSGCGVHSQAGGGPNPGGAAEGLESSHWMRPSPPPPPLTAGLDGAGIPPGVSLRDIPTIDLDPRGSSPANTPHVMMQDDPAQAIEGTVKDSGTRIGEGLPPVPAKLAQRIIKGEFIELHELLPELMSEPKDTTRSSSRTRAKKRLLDCTNGCSALLCTWGSWRLITQPECRS